MQVGQIVTGSSGKQYHVEKYLDGGVTSQVYQALKVGEPSQQAVALKVLRPDVSQVIVDHFWLEAQILAELAHAEQLVGDGTGHVPRLLDTQREGETQFLVLELVIGQPLDRLLEKNACLEEQVALAVAAQVLKVLELLHQQVQRSYTDFQLQNIWLRQATDGSFLGVKVMDWNHVSKRWLAGQPQPDDFDAQKDLARFAAYFYRMLTGKGADERGESERALQLRAGERWHNLSRGTRQIVLQALRRNPTRRFQDAAQFRQAVLAQQALWRQGWSALLRQVKKQLGASTLQAEEAEWALTVLDLVERKAPDLVTQLEHYRQQLTPHVGEISPAWQSGQQYYEAEQYRLAAQKWREEAEAKERVELWRWVMLAEIGVEVGRRTFASVRNQVQESIEALNEGEAKKALETLDALHRGGLRSPSFEVLRQEALARERINRAQQEEQGTQVDEWEKAASSYQEANKALQATTIPYASLIIEEEKEWPDLAARADALTQRVARDRGLDQIQADIERRLQNDFNDGLQALKRELLANPAHERLLKWCLKKGQDLLRSNQPAQAEALLAVGVLFGQVKQYEDSLLNIRHKSLEKVRQQRAVAELTEEHEQKLAVQREKYPEKLNAEEKQYLARVQTLQDSHHKAIEGERRRLEQEKARLKQEEARLKQEEAQLEQEKRELEREREELRTQHAQAMRSEGERQRQEKEDLRTQHTQAMKNERGRLEQEWNHLRNENDQVLEGVKEHSQRELANLQPRHQRELKRERERLQHEYQSKIEAEKRRLQQALANIQHRNDQQLLIEIRKLLKEERWDEFLLLLPQTKNRFFKNESRNWIKLINEKFERAVWYYHVPVAQKLEVVLNKLDPDPHGIKRRKHDFNSMMSELNHERDSWANALAGLINDLREESTQKEDNKQLIETIQWLLPLVEQRHHEFHQWLVEELEREINKQNAARRANNDPPLPSIEEQRKILQNLVELGLEQIGIMTPDSLDDAGQYFEEAIGLEHVAQDDPLIKEARAGQELILNLEDQNVSFRLVENTRLGQDLSSLMPPKRIQSLYQSPMIEWVEIAREYYHVSAKSNQEADRLSKISLNILILIEENVNQWWYQLTRDPNRLELSAIARLKRSVERFRSSNRFPK